MADKLTNLIRVELCLSRKWTGEFIYLKIGNRIKDTKNYDIDIDMFNEEQTY